MSVCAVSVEYSVRKTKSKSKFPPVCGKKQVFLASAFGFLGFRILRPVIYDLCINGKNEKQERVGVVDSFGSI